jgi:type IV pilus assembly protein PilE
MEEKMHKYEGFTLIELMTTVAIVAVLAAVAYPSYTDYLRKGRRVDAKNALMSAAQALERYYTENSRYDGTGSAIGTLFSATSTEGNYTLSYASGSPTSSAYTLQATPTGKQTGDKCGTFTINNFGQTDVTGGSLSRSSCW